MSSGSSRPKGKALKKETEQIRRISFLQPEHKFQTHIPCKENVNLRKLPLLRDCKQAQREELFVKKICHCCFLFDFLNPLSNMESKEMKTTALIELTEYITDEKRVLTERLYPEIIKMISVNIFRPFPPNDVEFDINEPEETFEDASWLHLKLVYQFFLKFLDLPDFDPALGRMHIDEQFLIQLLETISCNDPRERAYVKTALHRIYGKLLVHRSFIRQQMNNTFLRFIYETEKINGIAELLEIFGSIINGFVLPLKQEHKVFLQKVLIPLHKPKSLSLYHTQLMYCIMQFVEKEPNLTEQVIQGLLKFWPITCSQKQVMFLNEIEQVLDGMDPYYFERIQEPLFKRLAQCIASPHFLVSQRALSFWNNEDIVSLIEANSNVIMPIIFPALHHIVNDHWNQVIVDLVGEVLKIFENIHPELYERLKVAEKKKAESPSTKKL